MPEPHIETAEPLSHAEWEEISGSAEFRAGTKAAAEGLSRGDTSALRGLAAQDAKADAAAAVARSQKIELDLEVREPIGG